MPSKTAPEPVTESTPVAIAAGLSIAPEPGLHWFHRFGPIVSVVVLIGVQVAHELGYLPTIPSLQTIEALLTLLSGGWAARLGMTPPKSP